MSQSLARLPVHLITSTKNRAPLLREDLREPLHRYMASVLQNMQCRPLVINSVEDHVHILFELGRAVSVSRAVEDVKRSSSKWLKTRGDELGGFTWQKGYGAFAVSVSDIPKVQLYIGRQQEHHRKKTFQEEFRAILDHFGMSYDERYVWD